MKTQKKKAPRESSRKKKDSKPALLRAAEQMDVYDVQDVSDRITGETLLRFEDLGLSLPEEPPSEVVSTRLKK